MAVREVCIKIPWHVVYTNILATISYIAPLAEEKPEKKEKVVEKTAQYLKTLHTIKGISDEEYNRLLELLKEEKFKEIEAWALEKLTNALEKLAKGEK